MPTELQASEGWLLLLPPEKCLQQAYPQIVQLRMLIGLGYQDTEQVLMASLERMAGWVLNLGSPSTPSASLYLQALDHAVATLQSTPRPRPALNLALALSSVLENLQGALGAIRVHCGPQLADQFWGPYSCSLNGWARAHQKRQVFWRSTHSECASPPGWGAGLLAGRLLAGSTLAFLEQQGPELLLQLPFQARPSLNQRMSPACPPTMLEPTPLPLAHPTSQAGSVEGVSSLPPTLTSLEPGCQILRAVNSLCRRGIWNPQRPPYRYWQAHGQWHLLWPLTGADLGRELTQTALRTTPLSPQALLEELGHSNWVLGPPSQWIRQQLHPHSHKMVRAIVAIGALAETLAALEAGLERF